MGGGGATTIRVRADWLQTWAATALARAGASEPNARVTAESLVNASLRGIDTHGIVLLEDYLPRIGNGLVDGAASPSVELETVAALIVDGRNALGPVISNKAMSQCVEKAHSAGIGVAAIHDGNHFGAASVYANQGAGAGCVSIAMANGPAAMAPAGARRPIVSTNPIAIAAPPPHAGGPIPSLDMATSEVAQGKLYEALRRGEAIPLGWAHGPDGLPTTNPERGLAGSVAPMAGHKGFGLAVMVEIMAAALSGGRISPEIPAEDGPRGTSIFLCAISVGALRADTYSGIVSQLLDWIHSTPSAGADAIRVPGERSWRIAEERRRSGIPISADVRDLLIRLGASVGAPFNP